MMRWRESVTVGSIGATLLGGCGAVQSSPPSGDAGSRDTSAAEGSSGRLDGSQHGDTSLTRYDASRDDGSPDGNAHHDGGSDAFSDGPRDAVVRDARGEGGSDARRETGVADVSTPSDVRPRDSQADTPCPPGEVRCGGTCTNTATDLGNCGSCGATCAGTCTSGECIVTLAADPASPVDLAVANGYVYWTTDDSVKSVPVGGGPVATVVSLPLAYSPGLFLVARDATLYLAGGGAYVGAGYSNSGSILAAPLDGGTITTLAAAQDDPYGLNVTGGTVYWTNADSEMGSVVKAALDGGIVTTLAANLQGADSIAVDDTSVYWTSAYSYALMSVPISGGDPATVVTGNFYGGNEVLAVAAPNAYFIDNGDIVTVALDGGVAKTLASVQQAFVKALRIDSDAVYGLANSLTTSSIVKVSLTGGAPVTLATQMGYGESLAVDATSVYLLNAVGTDGAQIVKVTPK